MIELNVTNELKEMAISGYLGGFLILIVVYPFLYVSVNIFFHGVQQTKISRWLNGISCTLLVFLFGMHMQKEVTYGTEALEAWYCKNPTTKPPDLTLTCITTKPL